MCPQNRNKSNRKLGRTWCPKTTKLWCNFLITTTDSYVWVWISVGIKYRVVILTYLELSDCTMCDVEVWIKNKVILQKYTVQCYRTTATYKSSLSITSNKFWNRSPFSEIRSYVLAVAEKISSPEVAKRKHALLQEGGFSCCTITNKLTPNEAPTTCVPMLHRTASTSNYSSCHKNPEEHK